MKKRSMIILGATLAAIAVGIGAFGAHGLRDLLAETGKAGTFDTAVRYQFYHSIAIILVGILFGMYKNTKLKYAVWFFLIGIILFSGSLYALSIMQMTASWMMGMIAPVGGLSFISGWLLLAFGVMKKK